MKHKQKFGYILLGASIMLCGITIGQFITPNIGAQQDGYFDSIMCRQLIVKNPDDDMSRIYLSPPSVIITRGDKMAIKLQSSEQHGNVMTICNPQTGKRSVTMGSTETINWVSLWDLREEDSLSVGMFGTENKNEVFVTNPQTGKKGLEMKGDKFANHLTVSDYKNSTSSAFHFSSPSFDDLGNIALYYDRKQNKHTSLKD